MTENRLVSHLNFSLEGRLLVASPAWLNHFFSRAVCLMVHHSAAGAVGIFLNRPVNLDAGKLWRHLTGSATPSHSATPSPSAAASPSAPLQSAPLHFGGPKSGPVVAVHNRADLAEYTSVEGVYFAAQLQHLEQLLKLNDPGAAMKIIVGQADWGAGQLDQQFSEGRWLPLPVSAKLVFADHQQMWPKAIREVGNRYVAGIAGAHGQPDDILSN